MSSVFEAAITNYLGPILPYLQDTSVTEIMVNGPQEIFIERAGRLEKTPAQFADDDSLKAAIFAIAQSVGRRINEEKPTLDARLPDGSRVHAVFPPCSRNGTALSIRKFSKTRMSFKEYVQRGAISIEAAQFLDVCVFLGKNIIVSGGTGSGKTTLLSVLANRVPKGQRLIVIEDASELIIDYEHVLRFETRLPDDQGKGEVGMQELLKSSLRLRPDRIIVGEVRSSEAVQLVNAMNTGHKGCFGTIHANTPWDALTRLETLAIGGEMAVSEQAMRSQIASAVQMVIQISRIPDGSRRITNIAEVQGLNQDKTYKVIELFKMGRMKRDMDGRVQGLLEPTGEVPSFFEEIEDNRIPFPRDRFTKVA